MNQEIIELLERILHFAQERAGHHYSQEDDGTMSFSEDYKAYVSIIDDATTAIGLLKQLNLAEVKHPIGSDNKVNHKRSYCYACGTTVKDQKHCHGCGRKLQWPACPDCQPTQQDADQAMVEGFEHTISKEDNEWMNAPMGTHKQQPPASEFTNDVKFVVTAYKNCKKINPKNPLAVAESISDLLQKCEAYIRHCELHDCSEHPKANMFCTECPRYRKGIEAAIAKAKKETKVIKKHGGCWPQAKKEG